MLTENLNLHSSSSLQASFLHDYFWLKIFRYYSLKSWNAQDTNLMLFDLQTYGKYIYIYFVLLTAEAFFKVKKKLSLRDNHMKRMLCLFGRKYSILESHNSFYFAVINLYIGTNPSNFARTCCLLPSSLKCRQACRKGKPEDLRKNCPEVEEVHAYWECPINFASLASLVSFFIQILCRCVKGNLCMPWPTKWFLFSCTVLGILLTTYQY